MHNADPEILAELAEKGWLSLTKFAWGIAGVAFMTAKRMEERGELIVTRVGGINRVNADECMRFLTGGNLTEENALTAASKGQLGTPTYRKAAPRRLFSDPDRTEDDDF